MKKISDYLVGCLPSCFCLGAEEKDGKTREKAGGLQCDI